MEFKFSRYLTRSTDQLPSIWCPPPPPLPVSPFFSLLPSPTTTTTIQLPLVAPLPCPSCPPSSHVMQVSFSLIHLSLLAPSWSTWLPGVTLDRPANSLACFYFRLKSCPSTSIWERPLEIHTSELWFSGDSRASWGVIRVKVLYEYSGIVALWLIPWSWCVASPSDLPLRSILR